MYNSFNYLARRKERESIVQYKSYDERDKLTELEAFSTC